MKRINLNAGLIILSLVCCTLFVACKDDDDKKDKKLRKEPN